MRLTKIKLSGFKSFVDSVSIPINGNLVGIVGPNGCGKSNIIDAVRWVMGESSAKHLRGDTMADVIFNGSSTRKPVGVASVELVFDNTQSNRGGAFAVYNTIAIKRQVSRDGQSIYTLNGSKCRRKDITDIFLGTGLGSRSYAIIEQGTISRLIEAKPDNLRILIEEAAGISKYKDRRHDTEIRIRHTRENLERLNDLRDEVEKQIDHLKRQAKKAESFKALKAQEYQCRQQLLAIRWHTYQEQVSDYEGRAASGQRELDTALGKQTRFEKSISQSREEQNRLQQSLNTIQADLYGTAAEIGRIEQSIKLCNRTREDIEGELKRLSSDQQRALGELHDDTDQLAGIKRNISLSIESSRCARALENTTARLRKCADQVSARQQSNLDSIRRKLASEKEHVQVEGSRIDQFTEQSNQYTERKSRLTDELVEFRQHRLTEEIADLSRKITEQELERQSLRKKLTNLKERSDSQKQATRELNILQNEIRSNRQGCEGKIASLERLQQHAMGKDRTALNKWLKERGLIDSPRLAQVIEVENGWETAVELVLGMHLEAVCVETTNDHLGELAELGDETLAIIERGEVDSIEPIADRICLSEKVVSSYKIHALLKEIYCATGLDHAGLIANDLEVGQSVVTADGFWIGKGWLYLNRTTDQKTGVLARERELRSLNDSLSELKNRDRATGQALDESERKLLETDGLFEEYQTRERQVTLEISEYQNTLSSKSARHEHVCQRIVQIEGDIEEITKILDQNETLISESRDKRCTAEAAMKTLSDAGTHLSDLNQSLQDFIVDIHQVATDARDEVRRLAASLENLKSSEQLTIRHLQRLENQHHQEIERTAQLKQKMTETTTPIQGYQEDRDRLVAKKKQQDEGLKLARTRLTECEKVTTQLMEQQAGNHLHVEKKRSYLEKVRLDAQESRVRTQAVVEQLGELNVAQETVPDLLPDNADENLWREKVDCFMEKISRLGSINLAAIEEFEEQSQRSEYLSEQHDDLNESLQTLEQAMHKIDVESRSRFKTTFDQINTGLQTKFPKLFGGGQARLELTEADLLETGVTVIAQPPGKRNSSIHLLSGGEKALTAVALVFSIFELNPAPFCMLDEVDAPLDDANISRFGRLIEEMAERVQFIFITHNKATMESARHLAGVTMNEPGVSRMVAVDIDEAVELAVS